MEFQIFVVVGFSSLQEEFHFFFQNSNLCGKKILTKRNFCVAIEIKFSNFAQKSTKIWRIFRQSLVVLEKFLQLENPLSKFAFYESGRGRYERVSFFTNVED